MTFNDRRPGRATFDAYRRKFDTVKTSEFNPSPPRQVAEVVVDRRHPGILVVQADRHGKGEVVFVLRIAKMFRQFRPIPSLQAD